MDRALSRFADGLTDYSGAWPELIEEFHAEEKGQFESLGAQGGEVWAPLNPVYAGWKVIHFPASRSCNGRGALMESLTRESAPGAIVLKGRKDLRIGTSVLYAIYHQSIEPRTRLPRRPPVNFTERFKRWTMRHLHVFLVEMATRCGFRAGLSPLQVSAIETARKRSDDRLPAGAQGKEWGHAGPVRTRA